MSALLQGFFDRLLRRSGPTGRILPEIAPDEPPAERRRDVRTPVTQDALVEWLDEANAARAESAVILERSADGLEIRLSEPLPTGWPVLITPADELPVKAVVRHCRGLGDGARVGVRLIRNERRRFDRRPCDWEARLHWPLDETGKTLEQPARILDSGEGGIRVRVEQAVPEAVVARVAHQGWHRFGSVVACRPVRGSFELGLQFIGPPQPDDDVEYDG